MNLNKTSFKKGENVCIAYNTTSPINKVTCLMKLMMARISQGERYYEKESALITDCYAYEDGIIHYQEDESGYMHVFIGDKEYLYNPEAMYYYPDGTSIKKFDRICNGVIDMRHVVNEVHDINDVYGIFRKQMYTITDKDFVKTGISDLHGTQEELIELVFAGLVSLKYDSKTLALEEIKYNGLHDSVTKGKSFYTALSYGYSAGVVDRAVKGEVNLSGDVIIKSCPKLYICNLENTKCWKQFKIKSAVRYSYSTTMYVII